MFMGTSSLVFCESWVTNNQTFSQDGQTYIINQEKHTVRFQFDHPVSAFTTGFFSLHQGQRPHPAFAYATFHNKIYLYYNVSLPRITLYTLEDVIKSSTEEITFPASTTKREFVATVLYSKK